MKSFRSRFNVDPLSESQRRITSWFSTPLGRRMLLHERKVVAEELRYLFGYHFMQLSPVSNTNFGAASRINHCISMSPALSGLGDKNANIDGVADFDELPLDDDVIDVTVLHHVLEFSDNPHQVLKEAARVTIPKGYIIIVAFNPLSLSGLFQPLGALLNFSRISRRRRLRAARMKDWLEFLDFTCLSTKQVFHNLPINNARFLSSTRVVEKFNYKNKMPMGMSFVMVARKDKVGLTPIKPKWEKANLLGAMPIAKQAIAKQAIRANVAKEGLILPFRTKIKREF